MIERGDFVIQDVGTKRDISLEIAWECCFSPGQRVEMSMVFMRPNRPTNNCQTCKTDCGATTDEDIECQKCGLNFRRVLDLGDSPDSISKIDRTSLVSVPSFDKFGPALPESLRKRKRSESQEDTDEVSLFRRVRIHNIADILDLPNLPQSDLLYRAKFYGLRSHDWFDHGTGYVDIRRELKDGVQMPFLYIKAEDEPYLQLLSRRLPLQGDNLERMRDTLIAWTDDFSLTDWAISFQESDACAEIWRYINNLQNRI